MPILISTEGRGFVPKGGLVKYRKSVNIVKKVWTETQTNYLKICRRTENLFLVTRRYHWTLFGQHLRYKSTEKNIIINQLERSLEPHTNRNLEPKFFSW